MTTNTGCKVLSKFLLLFFNIGRVNYTNLQRSVPSDTRSPAEFPPFDLYVKLGMGRIGNHIGLTSDKNQHDVSKGQVALKEVQPLHEIPP